MQLLGLNSATVIVFFGCVRILQDVQLVADRGRVSSQSPSGFLLDINKALLAMADNELLLNSSELSGGLYEDFSSQEDTLRVRPAGYEFKLNFCDVLRVGHVT